MIKCSLDPSIEEESKCAWCCIHCDEKDCENRCEGSKIWDEEEIIAKCTFV